MLQPSPPLLWSLSLSTNELVVLGTASQVPTRFRNHNGYLLLWDGQGIMFDPGEGTQRQMTLAGVRASQIHRICVTHFHGDHCLGLPGVLQRLSLDEVKHPVRLYYPASGQKYLDRLRNASIHRSQVQLITQGVSTPGIVETDDRLTLSTAPLKHTVPTWGWRLEAPPTWKFDPAKLKAAGVFGRDVGTLAKQGFVTADGKTVQREDVATLTKGLSMSFVMDTAPCDAAIELSKGVDMMVMESTYLSQFQAEAHARGHSTAVDAAKIAQQAGAHKLVLSHFSQRHPDNKAFEREARAIHPNVVAAHDLMRIPFRRRGT